MIGYWYLRLTQVLMPREIADVLGLNPVDVIQGDKPGEFWLILRGGDFVRIPKLIPKGGIFHTAPDEHIRITESEIRDTMPKHLDPFKFE